MKSQSEQESAIEEFLSRSFGSAALFRPKKWIKRGVPKEPADLAWAVGSIVAIFHLQRANGALDKQVDHNRRQANGYVRLWKKGAALHTLQGKSRFGDSFYVRYVDVKRLIRFNVVSAPCAVLVTQTEPGHLEIVIPEHLLRWLARGAGSVVDLLRIVLLANQIQAERPWAGPSALRFLDEVVHGYVIHTAKLFSSDRDSVGDEDIQHLAHQVYRMRLVGNASPQSFDSNWRASVGRIFGDLCIGDMYALMTAFGEVRRRARPPDYVYYAVAGAGFEHYFFAVSSAMLGSKASVTVVGQMIEAEKVHAAGRATIYLAYHVSKGVPYKNSFFMFGMPEQEKPLQSELLFDQITSGLNLPNST
ncbi:MAG: hypothetical protein EOP38_24395 [Rubrivivax sp.]|nr:MAG: hypothetical protein EOP38_24395 [Rubrivivax sp.]